MRIVLGDITKMDTDAIVNAAVSDLSPCPGICSAIFAAADTEELKKACRKIGRCRIGHAVVTPSCGLPSKIIFHVAGAGWYGGVQRERMLLEECYRRALQKALLYNCRTVAVPLIFSGDCHMPRADMRLPTDNSQSRPWAKHPTPVKILLFPPLPVYNSFSGPYVPL